MKNKVQKMGTQGTFKHPNSDLVQYAVNCRSVIKVEPGMWTEISVCLKRKGQCKVSINHSGKM